MSRRAKCLIWLGAAFVVYTVAGFFVAPIVIKSQMLKRLPPMLKRPVAVAEVKVNPYTLSLTIRGLAVNENDGSRFAGWDEMFAQLGYSSFVRRGWSVREVSLIHPFAHLSRGKDGKLNVDDILAALAGATPAQAVPAKKSALPLVRMDLLHIEGADVAVEDFVPSKPVRTKILPAHLQLENLSTEPGAKNPYVLNAASDTGETFQWTGAFTIDPPQVFGNFAIKELDLKKYSPYLAQFAKAEVADGRLDVVANYTAGLDTNGVELALSTGEVLLKSFVLKSTLTGETVATVPTLSVSIADADLAKRRIHVSSFSTSGGTILARQEKDGKINLLDMIVNAPAPTGAASSASTNAPWVVIVDSVGVDGYSVAVEDKKPDKPASLNVHDISFKAKGVSTAGDDPIAMEIGLNLGESGRFTTKGTVRLQPPEADMDLQLVGLDLRQIQPYVEQQVKLAITKGLLSAQGHAHYNSGTNSPMATFEGGVGLTNFVTADLVHFKDFVKFDSLTVSGIKFAFQPNQLDVAEVRLDGLSTTISVDASNQINLLTVLPKSGAGASNAAPAPASAAGALGFPATVGSFVFDNASLHLNDQSIEPNCLFDVQQFGGSVKGLSSQPDSRAQVDVHGKVDEVSTFSVTGAANILSSKLAVQVAVDCKNVDLTPFTPYMEKFGGFPLQRGKLLVDLSYEIDQRKLSASNHVVVAGLTLGSRNSSTNATHLPVKLGIALLKDRNGNIILDVPLSGSLDSPDFKIMPIVMQVVVNILEKAATSPFTLLGALFGGGEELSYIDFQPGMADITPAEQVKIDKLAKSLYERPALQLEIAGTVDPLTDSPALAQAKLSDQIRSLRARELIEAGTPAESVLSVQVDPTNYARLIASLYHQTFGTNTPPTNAMATATEPLPIATAAATNFPAIPAPTAPQPMARRDVGMVKGGQRMMLLARPESSAPHSAGGANVTALPGSSTMAATEPSATATSAPPGIAGQAGELTGAQMEAALLGRIQITPDDLRALMVERTRSVQAALLRTGNVEGERMDILSPKPIDPTAKGEARANLSLD